MTGWLALGGVLLVGFALFSLMLAMVLVFLKAVFFLVLLPFRLLFWGLGAVAMLVGAAIALVAGVALLLAPLLPLVLLVGLVYGMVQLVKRPATA
ncbi:MAG: hypothetical protein HQ485_00140 [Acidobacteria bacterium]|nr:hypothetical protein [Acidobacteriota bacterium]